MCVYMIWSHTVINYVPRGSVHNDNTAQHDDNDGEQTIYDCIGSLAAYCQWTNLG